MRIPFHSVRYILLRPVIGRLGKHDEICRSIEFTNPRNIYIGSYCTINKHCLLDGRGGKIRIGNSVDIAQETNIWTLQHDHNDDKHISVGGDVTIEDNVWIASRVTILPGVILGKGSVVACGAVVTKDVPPLAIVGGVPAKIIGYRKNKLEYRIGDKRWFH